MNRHATRRIFLAIVALAMIASLFLPAAKLYVHSQLGGETAALFPEHTSAWQMAFAPHSGLPADAIPALGLVTYSAVYQVIAAVLLVLSAAAISLGGRKQTIAGLILAALSVPFSGAFVLQLTNLSSSLLFRLLITPQIAIYLPLAGAVVLMLTAVVSLHGSKAEREAEGYKKAPSLLSEKQWRLLCAVLALLSALVMLLPVYSISVPETVTGSPADAAALNRNVSMLEAGLGRDSMLSDLKAEGSFQDVITGDIGALEPFSADANNIRGIFLIGQSSSTQTMNIAVIAGLVLLVLAGVLALIPSIDKWFPTVLATLGAIAAGSAILGVMSVGDPDMYTGASRQILHLGLGTVTPWGLCSVMLAAFSAVSGMLCIRTANAPYFVSPIPQNHLLQFVAAVLAVMAIAFTFLPVGTVNFYTPGKTKVTSSVELTGLQAMSLRAPDSMAAPTSGKGKTLYSEEAGEGELTASSVAATMNGMVRNLGLVTWAALILAGLGLILVFLRQRRAAVALFLAAFVLRALTWLLLSTSMPKSIGTAGGALWLYVSMPLLVFAGFFANFMHLEELPKKYKLFLMMLPFLIAVFLFAYLPLYGWSYAFYNYKFGVPLSEQEFVGFKWFGEMWTNQANRENIVRVLKNTFGMSGLNLATSWLPMIFAVFLNEVTNTRFKKAVQIFTTLPNFISWALVFSFALCLFAMDTGIWSKFMLGIGAIKEPVVWLNSSEHIWLKMWAWSTWKGLGWGAIMYLAAIAGIPQELYEAAKVDGANRWHQMRYITLPSLLPTFFVLLLLSISNILNNGMDQYLVFQNPMNKQTIEVLDLYVYNITIASRGTTLYSFATAIGILKTIVSVTLLFSANFISKKLRGESIV